MQEPHFLVETFWGIFFIEGEGKIYSSFISSGVSSFQFCRKY